MLFNQGPAQSLTQFLKKSLALPMITWLPVSRWGLQGLGVGSAYYLSPFERNAEGGA